MSVAKVIEVFTEGSTIEQAIENAVKEASSSVNNIKGVYVKEIKADVQDNAIVNYRINSKVTFVVQK